MKKNLQSIVIKPIGAFCNLACDYCFYLDKHKLYEGAPSTHRMKDATVEKLIKEMFACSNSPTFTWQGGEPTVLGLEFFQRAMALTKQYANGRPYSVAIQTSGFLLDEDWADFFRREGILVGISLDGPEHIHDRYRRDRQGRGTFQQVFKNAKMLLEKGVEVNLLATVTDYASDYAEEIYQFFVENGFHFMQFSPVVELHPSNPKIATPYSVTANHYGQFLHHLFKCWNKDFDQEKLKQKTSIRFFDSLLKKYIGMEPDHCVMHKTCNDYLVVEHNGDLFSCDFLVSENTHLGNLHKISLNQAFQSEAHIQFGQGKANYDEQCQRCQWLQLCYGGCIKDRIHDPRDEGHNHFCESYLFFFKKADKRLSELASLYRQFYLK
ncbi:MAG: anaerobic sulfatase maturase [Pseudomonadota bacterium]